MFQDHLHKIPYTLDNAAPTSSNRTVTMDEDTEYPFTSADFAFTDTDSGDGLVSVKVVTLPAAGSLALDGAAVTAGQVIGTSDLGRLRYTPPANAHGSGYASFTFKVSDGVSESASANTMTINVTAVDDPASGLAITGTIRVGQTLTADTSKIVDADGLTSPNYRYQWVRVDGSTETDLGTASTHVVTTTDQGKKLKVEVTLTDDDSNTATLEAETGTVLGAVGVTLAVNPDEIGEEAPPTTVTVTATLNDGTRVAATTVTVSVDSGTAIEGTDFGDVEIFEITIPENTLSQTGTFNMSPIQDELNEPEESVSITGATGELGLLVMGAEISVTDDDSLPMVTLTLTPASISESDDVGTTDVAENKTTVTALLDRASSMDTTVTVSMEPMPPALSGDGRMSSNTLLTIEAGLMQSIGVVTLEAVNNDVDEADKRMMVTGVAVNELGVTGPENVMLEIRNDDAPLVAEKATEAPLPPPVTEKVPKAPLAPPPPMVTATPGSQNSIDVSWSAPPNTGRPDIQHYNLQYRQGESGNWIAGPQDVNGMTATIVGLVPATVYQVRVRAVNADGDGAWSQPGTGCTAKAPLAPPPPMVTATPGSQNSIDVSWSAPPNTGRPDIQHYNLQYRQGESGNWIAGPQDVNGMTATIAGLVPATVYQVRVRAVNADGDGAWSQPGTGCTAKVPLAPPPPMVTATPGSQNSIDVSWSAPPNTGRPDIQHYDLQYRQGAGGNWTDGPQDVNGMTATIVGLVPATVYQVRVRAVNADGDGAWSQPGTGCTAKAPLAPPPPMVTATPGSRKSLDVSWTAPPNTGRPDIQHYDLQYRQGEGGSWTDGPQDVNGMTATIAGLVPYTAYQVRVRAVNADGNGAWSEPGTGSTNTDNSKAWVTRFGRTVADQVSEVVRDRLSASLAEGFEVTLAGASVPTWSTEGQTDVDRLQFFDGEVGEPSTRSMTKDELLTSSNFTFNTRTDIGGPNFGLWGRGVRSSYSGVDDALSLDGDVLTIMFGTDYKQDAWHAGVTISQSVGEGATTDETGTVDIEGSLVGVYPYLGYQATDQLSFWGMTGYATGDYELHLLDALDEPDERIRAGLSMTMLAFGARGELVSRREAVGLELAYVTDGLLVRTRSGPLPWFGSSEGDATRFRLGLESSWKMALVSGAMFAPTFGIDLRHDGGDAETGFGLDINGGIVFTNVANTLTLELEGHTLLTHENKNFRERSISGSLTYDSRPDSPYGPLFSLKQVSDAQYTGGVDAVLERTTTADIVSEDRIDSQSNFEAELAWALPAFGGRVISIPYIGVGPGNGDLHFGWKLLPSSPPERFDYDLGLEVRRRVNGNEDSNPENSIELRATVTW